MLDRGACLFDRNGIFAVDAAEDVRVGGSGRVVDLLVSDAMYAALSEFEARTGDDSEA